MSRRQLLLGVLAVLLGLSLAYAWWASPRQERVAKSNRPPVREAGPAPAATEPVVNERRVRLEILDREGEEFAEPTRDIFRLSGERPESVEAEPVETISFAPTPTFSPVEVPSVEMPGAVASKVIFLGFLEKNAEKKVFLSLDNEVYIVRQGERFGPGQEFEVDEIATDKLVVRQGDVPVTVSMADAAAQTPSLSKRADRTPPAGGRPPGFGNGPPPVSPEEMETFDEEGGGEEEAPIDVVEEPPAEPEPPVEGESGAGAEDSMSTLQLRSTIQ